MSRDVRTCLRDALRFHQEGQRNRAIKRLEEAIRLLRRPLPALPKWVVEGARVQWADGCHYELKDTFLVTEVHRENPWWFRCERTLADGSVVSKVTFEQETFEHTRRSWKCYA
jgi:hypothetical protein